MAPSKHKPPKRQKGWGKGKRRFTGEILDVHATAQMWFGGSEDTVRSRVSNGLLPYRKYGGRLIFIRSEVEAFFNNLPGVSLEEVRENIKAREGVE